MKRPTGVTVSAVLLFLGSAVLVLFAVLMAFTGITASSLPRASVAPGVQTMPQPGFLMAVMIAEAAFILAMAVWGFITFAGLLRMRGWARISMIVIGGGQALLSGPSALIMLVLVFVPFPLPAGQDPVQAQAAGAIMKYVFGGMGLVAALHAALGIWWIVYFARKKTAAAFATARTASGAFNLVQSASAISDPGLTLADVPAPGPVPVGSRGPLLISILAVLNLVGAVFCLLASAQPVPALFFGAILEGRQKVLLYLVFVALQATIGIGLWRLRPWGWLLALVFAVWGILYSAYLMAAPSAYLRYSQEVASRFGAPPMLPGMEGFQKTMMAFSFGFSILWCGAILWVLIHFRAAFRPPSEPTLVEPSPRE